MPLQRRACKSYRRNLPSPWRHTRGKRLRRLFQRMGRTNLNHVSRLDGLRTAAQRSGAGRAGNAQHHGDISLDKYGLNSTAALHAMIEAKNWRMPTSSATSGTRNFPLSRSSNFSPRILPPSVPSRSIQTRRIAALAPHIATGQ